MSAFEIMPDPAEVELAVSRLERSQQQPEEEAELSEHDLLLVQIYMATQDAAEYLENDANYLMGVVFPRHKTRFRWRGKETRLWRLNLDHPLWISASGEIDQGYDIDEWEDVEYPQYLVRAEIELYDDEDLKQVLKAVQAITPPTSPEMPATWDIYPRLNTER